MSEDIHYDGAIYTPGQFKEITKLLASGFIEDRILVRYGYCGLGAQDDQWKGTHCPTLTLTVDGVAYPLERVASMVRGFMSMAQDCKPLPTRIAKCQKKAA